MTPFIKSFTIHAHIQFGTTDSFNNFRCHCNYFAATFSFLGVLFASYKNHWCINVLSFENMPSWPSMSQIENLNFNKLNLVIITILKSIMHSKLEKSVAFCGGDFLRAILADHLSCTRYAATVGVVIFNFPILMNSRACVIVMVAVHVSHLYVSGLIVDIPF